MTLGYDKQDYFETKIKNKVDIVLPRKTSNILISGKSGSGKSQSCRWYIWQLLHNKESLVYLSDYKGGEEYEPFEGSASYASGERALAMIDDFYRLFLPKLDGRKSDWRSISRCLSKNGSDWFPTLNRSQRS